MTLYWSCVTFVGSEVTIFYEISITQMWSNVVEVAQLCTIYMNAVSEVYRDLAPRGLGNQWIRKEDTTLKTCGGHEKRFKICSNTNDLAKAFSNDLCENPGRNSKHNTLKNAFCISIFAIQNHCVSPSYRFQFEACLWTQTITRQRIYMKLHSFVIKGHSFCRRNEEEEEEEEV